MNVKLNIILLQYKVSRVRVINVVTATFTILVQKFRLSDNARRLYNIYNCEIFKTVLSL